MSAWVTISTDDVLESLSSAEVDKYREFVAEGQTDPLPGIISKTTDEGRGYVGSQTELSAAGLPPEVVNAVIDIVIYRLCKRAAIQTADQRKAAADDAVKFLQGVAAGKSSVSPADGSFITPVLPSVEDPDNTFQRADQDGI